MQDNLYNRQGKAMIESIDNYIQLALTGICAGISLYRAVMTRRRSWVLITLFYSAYFMGNLYWQLYYIFREGNPHIFYVSELSWYVSDVFLFLFLYYQREPKASARTCRIKWLIPLFAAGLSIYYMTFGQIISNIISAFLMSLIAMEAVEGLCEIKARTGACNPAMKPVYVLVLVFFFAEYALWTSSCIWFDDFSAMNPYYYIDMIISATLLILLLFINRVPDIEEDIEE